MPGALTPGGRKLEVQFDNPTGGCRLKKCAVSIAQKPGIHSSIRFSLQNTIAREDNARSLILRQLELNTDLLLPVRGSVNT